jgi:hypothetical protein
MHLAKKYLLLVSICGLLSTSVFASEPALWLDKKDIAARGLDNEPNSNDRGVKSARTLSLNTEAMKSLLVSAIKDITTDTARQARASKQISIELPLPDGSNIELKLEQTELLPAGLAAKFAGIKTFKVAEANGNIISGRVDITELGFHAMLQTIDGQTIFIDPASKAISNDYLSYRKADQSNEGTLHYGTPEGHAEIHESFSSSFSLFKNRIAARTRSNEGIIEYRLAVAATGEYTQLQGGTVSAAISAMVTTLNRVNHIYEQSFGIRLSLVENNDLLIYTQSATDPYSNYNIQQMLGENQRNLDSVIGSSNYDIGHVFGTSGGGLAYIGSVCNGSSKARGASGIRNPNNDSFDVDYVSHEIGHQFGATHTFNSDQGICTSGARTSRSAFEPGSGSSIMSYAGGCGTDDLQSFSDAMFHSGNIEQVNSNVLTGTASSCGILHQTDNTAPLAFAGNSYTIPAHTPFELVANAIDADNDSLKYSWEQVDIGAASSLKIDTGNNPLFRILPPTSNATRTFPSLTTILGTGFVKGESLPSTDRTMKFQVAVYDGYHAPSLDRVSINVSNQGEAFKLQTPASQYAQETYADIFWNTANTQNAPISCPSVDISLSIDGGKEFNVVLGKGLPNSGSAKVYLPSSIISTSAGRFKLSCSNNIFFSISSSNFTISQNIQGSSAGPRSVENADLAEATTTGGGGSMGLPLFLLLFIALLFKKQAAK